MLPLPHRLLFCSITDESCPELTHLVAGVDIDGASPELDGATPRDELGGDLLLEVAEAKQGHRHRKCRFGGATGHQQAISAEESNGTAAVPMASGVGGSDFGREGEELAASAATTKPEHEGQ